MQAKWRKTYRVHWAKYFGLYLKYKKPYLINGGLYHNIDDELDTLDHYGGNERRIIMGTPESHRDSTDDEELRIP